MTDTTTEAAVETPPTLAHKIAAEALGTFVLVFIGCGTAVFAATSDAWYVAVALAFGLTVLTMVYAVGRISGGHFNPAVSVGVAISGRTPWTTAGIYIAAQVAAGVVAAAALFAILHGFEWYESGDGLGANNFGDIGNGIAWWSAFLLEFLLTAIFVWVILGATDARNKANAALAPVAIGLALTMVHLVGIGATGTSVNPARSIGPALFTDTDHMVQLWLFIAAPLLGGLVAGITYALMFGQDAPPVPGSGLNFSSGPKQGQFTPAGYDQQWNPGQAGGWQQPQQQWAPPPPHAQPGQPAQQWGAPPAPPAQQQWGAPGGEQPYAAPQDPAQQQWGAPPAPAAGGQTPGQPGHWGNPEGDDDGRTQVRRPD
jgi:MIP family channel proteins